MSHELFHDVVSSVDAVILSVCVHLRELLYVSPNAPSVFGVEPRTLVRSPDRWRELVHPEDIALLERSHAAVFDLGFVDFDFRILRAGLDVRWIQATARLLRTEAGEPDRLDIVFVDVTRRRSVLVDREKLIRLGAEPARTASVSARRVEFFAEPRLDHEGRIRFDGPSEGVSRLFEVDPTHAQDDAMCIVERIHPEDRRRVQSAFATSARDGTALFFEHRVVLPKGGLRWVRVAATPQRVVEGGVVWKAHFADITEAVETQKRSVGVDSRLRFAVEAAEIGFWEYHPTTDRLVLDPVAKQILPLLPRREDLDGWKDNLHPEDQELFEQALRRTLRDEVPFDCDFRVVGREPATPRHYRAKATVNREDASGDVFVTGILHDVTVELRSASTLREALALLDRYFMLSLDLLCIVDHRGRFIRMNPAWERVLGHPLADLHRRQYIDLVHPQDRRETLAVMSAMTDGAVIDGFVNRYRAANGSYRSIEWRAQEVGGMFYAAARDVTEREIAQRKVQASERRLRTYIERSPIAIVVLDEHRRVIEANDALHQLAGDIVATDGTVSIDAWIHDADQGIWTHHVEVLHERDTARSTVRVLPSPARRPQWCSSSRRGSTTARAWRFWKTSSRSSKWRRCSARPPPRPKQRAVPRASSWPT
ncbi:MAG: PAS domain-containing protein [Myxococcales bacterium]|nr:PAS domain-containing protein [Myxococcales bacterium]